MTHDTYIRTRFTNLYPRDMNLLTNRIMRFLLPHIPE